MNSKLIVAVIVVVVLLLAGGGFYVMSNKTKSAPQTSQAEQTTQTAPSPTEKPQKSLKDLLSFGQGQQCTFTVPDGGTGTVYVGDQKMRGDIDTTVSGKTVTSHMIIEDKTNYVWMDDQTTGMKMTLADVSPAPASSSTNNKPAANNQGVDLDQKVDYNCQNWSIDSSKFALPKNVKFTDLSSLMKAVPAGSASGTPDARTCAACDQAPEVARAQCKAALGCK